MNTQAIRQILHYARRTGWRALTRGPECLLPTIWFSLTRRLIPFTTRSGYRIQNRQQLICYWDHHIDARLYRGWSVNPGETVLDIGANYGVFGWEVAKRYPESRLIGFEPYPALADYCCRLRVYHSVRQIALAEEPGEAPLLIRSAEGSWTATIDDYPGCQWEPACAHPTSRSTVPTARLDDLQENQPPPAVIKIDVDGGELLVAHGGIKTLRSARYLIVELCDAPRVRAFSDLIGNAPSRRLTDVDFLYCGPNAI